MFPFKLPLVLDGATGTNLMANGMPSDLCTEQYVLDNPESIVSLQKEFIESGSDCIYSPTFSANRARLKYFHLNHDVTSLNHQLLSLSKQASQGKALIGGDMSPLMLACEPFGEHPFQELVDIYSEQANALKEAGADFLVLETMMSLASCRAGVFAAVKTGLPVFVTITVDDKGKTPTGDDMLSILITLQELKIAAFGLNCSHGPDTMEKLIAELYPYAKIPLIAKPNAGMPNILIPTQYDLSPEHFAKAMELIMESGAEIVGGCCGTTPEHMKALRTMVDSFDRSKIKLQKDTESLIAAGEKQIYYLHEHMVFSEPLFCEHDMSEDIIEAESIGADILTILIQSQEDALNFALNAYMCTLPVCFLSNNSTALNMALYLFHGRAIVDSKCEIPEEELKNICNQYGAFLY